MPLLESYSVLALSPFSGESTWYQRAGYEAHFGSQLQIQQDLRTFRLALSTQVFGEKDKNISSVPILLVQSPRHSWLSFWNLPFFLHLPFTLLSTATCLLGYTSLLKITNPGLMTALLLHPTKRRWTLVEWT